MTKKETLLKTTSSVLKILQIFLLLPHRPVVLAHDGLLADISLFGRLFEVHALFSQEDDPTPLHFLLEARDELFVGFFGVFLEMNHRCGTGCRVQEIS